MKSILVVCILFLQIGAHAKIVLDSASVVIIPVASPKQEVRDIARKMIEEGGTRLLKFLLMQTLKHV